MILIALVFLGLNNILKTKSKNFENISPSRNGEPRITHYMMLNNININDIQKVRYKFSFHLSFLLGLSFLI